MKYYALGLPIDAAKPFKLNASNFKQYIPAQGEIILYTTKEEADKVVKKLIKDQNKQLREKIKKEQKAAKKSLKEKRTSTKVQPSVTEYQHYPIFELTIRCSDEEEVRASIDVNNAAIELRKIWLPTQVCIDLRDLKVQPVHSQGNVAPPQTNLSTPTDHPHAVTQKSFLRRLITPKSLTFLAGSTLYLVYGLPMTLQELYYFNMLPETVLPFIMLGAGLTVGAGLLSIGIVAGGKKLLNTASQSIKNHFLQSEQAAPTQVVAEHNPDASPYPSNSLLLVTPPPVLFSSQGSSSSATLSCAKIANDSKLSDSKRSASFPG